MDERKVAGAGRKEQVRQEVQTHVEIPQCVWDRALKGADSSLSGRVLGGGGGEH